MSGEGPAPRGVAGRVFRAGVAGGVSRRGFIVGSGAALALLGCGQGVPGAEEEEPDVEDEGVGDDEELADGILDGVSDGDISEAESRVDGVVTDADVPTGAAIFAWVNQIVDEGVRRPGYAATGRVEQWALNQFEAMGVEDVRLEPVTVPRWEPVAQSLQVTVGDDAPVSLECFPVPYCPNTEGLELELASFDADSPQRVAGKAALYRVSLLDGPADQFLGAGSAPAELADRVVDPDGTLGERHLLPFGAEHGRVLAPVADAGAGMFIGWVDNHPGGTRHYFAPGAELDGSLPGVWLSAEDGRWLRDRLDDGDDVQVSLRVWSRERDVLAHNVVAELPGVDEDVVRLSSHLDAPWDSAVEGASGAALVLAQARYWVAQPVEQRPHRLVFVLHAGQFADGAGARRYVEDHPREQDRLVLHMVLEQAALEAEAQPGDAPVATERPAPRWFFTSRIPRLEQTVMEACAVEAVHRSMLLAPDAVPGQSPADGPYPYDEEVPLVHLRSLPHYIYDPGDTAELVDQEALAPLTRATVRIVASTSGVSANAMRSAEFSASG